MTDLATLGIRVEGQEVVTADAQLDGLAAAAGKAETATERLAAAARGNGAAMMTMNTAVRQQNAVLGAARNSMGLTTTEGLNLSRQFSDIAVTAAMGMNPLMILIQQGPQIADVFQTAAQRGVGFNAVLRSIFEMLRPVMAVLAPIGIAVGAVGSAFALAARSMNADGKNLADGLGLADEQLKKLKKSGEETAITLGDAFLSFGTTVKEVLGEAFGSEIDAAKSAWSGFLDDLTANTAKEIKAILGFFIGGYEAIKATWSMLPAAIGDAATTAANAVLRAIEWMVNKGIEGINKLIAGAKALSVVNPAFALARGVGEIAPISLGQMGNGNAGALGAAMGTAADAFQVGQSRADAMVDGFGRRWAQNARDTALARIREAAGDPNKGRTGKTEAEREIEAINKYIQALKDQAATMGMTAIAAKEYEINQKAVAAAEHGLDDAVRAAGAQLLTQMRIKAADMKGKAEDLEMIRLETQLLGSGNVERAVQIAQLRERQRLIGAGVDPVSAIGAGAIGAAGDIARDRENLRIGQDRFNDSLRVSLDLAQQLDDQAREMARGLADAFGEPGRALGDLMTTMTGFQARLESIAERRATMERQGTLTVERAAMLERERAQAQVQNYGDMISAAKGFFAEGSDGYKALQTAEQAYRVFQFAMMVQSMIMGGQETAATVAQNGIKALSHGVVAVARAIASLPFPLNLAAGAATIAALAAIGVKIAGGGGGGSGSGAAPVGDQVLTNRRMQAQSALSAGQAGQAGQSGPWGGSQVFDMRGAVVTEQLMADVNAKVAAGEARVIKAVPKVVNRGIAKGHIGEPAWGVG